MGTEPLAGLPLHRVRRRGQWRQSGSQAGVPRRPWIPWKWGPRPTEGLLRHTHKRGRGMCRMHLLPFGNTRYLQIHCQYTNVRPIHTQSLIKDYPCVSHLVTYTAETPTAELHVSLHSGKTRWGRELVTVLTNPAPSAPLAPHDLNALSCLPASRGR